MDNYNIKFVYGNLTEKEKKEIIELWVNSGVLNNTEALKRVEQVSILVYSNDVLIGVSTVYINDFIYPNNPYFFFRMFIQKDFRGSNKLRNEIVTLNFEMLKNNYDKQAHGIVVELENTKLAKLGQKTNYMNKRGYLYHGKSARGLQLWYVRFDDPRGIFQ